MKLFKLLFAIFLAENTLLNAETRWAPLAEAGTASGSRVTGKVIGAEGATRIEAARVQGRVVNILRREGEHISAGSPVVEISSPECTSLVEERLVAEKRGLLDLKEAATLRYKQLGLEIENGRCEIVASHPGTIVKRQVELGAAFNIGDALMTVLDTKNLIIELDVPERLLSTIKEGQSVRFTLASMPAQTLTTTIERVLPTLDSATRTTKVRLKAVPLPKHATLDSLVFGEIVGGADRRLLRAPVTAFVFHHNRQYVVKDAQPEPIAVPVEIIDESETESSIRAMTPDSLHVGDRVAVRGAIFLFNQISSTKPIP